jgi:hypothetical protein
MFHRTGFSVPLGCRLRSCTAIVFTEVPREAGFGGAIGGVGALMETAVEQYNSELIDRQPAFGGWRNLECETAESVRW